MLSAKDIESEYDKLDVDNLFIIIHKDNLKSYYTMYNCENEIELEDFLWYNFGISIKVI